MDDYQIVSSGICKICMLNPANFIIPTCDHAFCEQCIKDYLSIKIIEGEVIKISCPEPDCKKVLTPRVIESVLPELLQKFLYFTEKKIKESNPNFRWCPNRECSGFDEKNISNKLICNQCQTAFCYLCTEAWHEGLCTEDSNFNKKYLKRCPQCSVVIEKNYGCPELSCTICGFRFCWLCGQGMSIHNIRKCIFLSQNYKFYWIFGTILLFFPVFLVFFVPSLLGLTIYYEDGLDKFKKNKVKFYCGFFFGTLLSPIISPLIFLLYILFFGPFYLIVKLFRKIDDKVLKICFVLCAAPLLYAFFVIGIANVFIAMNLVVPILGSAILIYKLILVCC